MRLCTYVKIVSCLFFAKLRFFILLLCFPFSGAYLSLQLHAYCSVCCGLCVVVAVIIIIE